MRINITKEQFSKLSGFSLGQELIQPIIQKVRGQRIEIKRAVYEVLTPGQKSLFAFWVMYGHTGSGWLQFFQEGLYIGGYEQFLPMIKAGFRHINDLAMLENVIWAEEVYSQYRACLSTVREPADSDELAQAFAPASEQLLALLPETMSKIETYIRNQPEEFVTFIK